MSKVTLTKRMRMHFGAKDGRVYDALPMNVKLCAVCQTEMMVADGSTANYHKCCRGYRNNKYGAFNHIEKEHVK